MGTSSGLIQTTHRNQYVDMLDHLKIGAENDVTVEMKVKTTKIAHCKRCCATSNLTSSIMDGLLCERCLTELRRVRGLTAQISNTHTGTPPIVRHKDGTMGNVEKIQGDNLVVNVPSYGKQLWAISDVEYLLERVYDDQVPSR